VARAMNDAAADGDGGAGGDGAAEDAEDAEDVAMPQYPGRQMWVEWHLLLRVTAAVLLVAAAVCVLAHRDAYAWVSGVTGVLALVGGFLPFRRQAVRIW